MNIKVTAILIATVILLAMLLFMLILNTARAEMECGECEALVNEIFEADWRDKLLPPLDNRQILELNNACDREWITEDDIKEIAPQYWGKDYDE